MCHRLLKFIRHTGCGHNTYQGDTFIDCHSEDCILSSSHPEHCGSSSQPCNCRRYYSQPQRLITQQLPDNCPRCPTS